MELGERALEKRGKKLRVLWAEQWWERGIFVEEWMWSDENGKQYRCWVKDNGGSRAHAASQRHPIGLSSGVGDGDKQLDGLVDKCVM